MGHYNILTCYGYCLLLGKNDDDIVGGSKQMKKKQLLSNNRDWGKGFGLTING